MRSHILIFFLILLLAFLAVNWGGVTPDGETALISGAVLLFIFVLIVRAFEPDFRLEIGLPLLIPVSLIGGAVLIQLLSPIKAPGRPVCRQIIAYSLITSAIILAKPRQSDLLFFYLFVLLGGVGLVVYGLQREGWRPGAVPLTATYLNRNHFAALLGLVWPLAVSFGLGSSEKILRWHSRAACFILLGGIILTRSRGGILAAIVSLVLVGGIYPGIKRVRKKILVISALILLGVLVGLAVYFFQESSLYYSPSLDALSVRTRISIWGSTFRLFLARPVTGWGWGTFRSVYPAFKEPEVWYSVPHAHNEFLQVLSEGGAVGFVILLLCLVSAVSILYQNYRNRPDSSIGLFCLGVLGSIGYVLIHAGFDFILRLPANSVLLAALVGLGLGVAADGKEREIIFTSRKTGILLVVPLLFILIYFSLLSSLRARRAALLARQGEKLLAAGRSKAALNQFERAEEFNPDSSRAMVGQAEAKIKLFSQSGEKHRLYRSILTDLTKARDKNPRNLRPLWKLISFHRELGDFEKAEKYLETALTIDPHSPFLLTARARNRLSRNKYREAVRDLHRAVDIYPSAWDSARKLLFSHTHDYEILKDLPPNRDNYHRNLGYHLLADNKPEDARREFETAVELNPDNPLNHRALGRLYLAAGELEKAAGYYDQILSRFEPEAGWLAERGDLAIRLGREKEAARYYRRAYNLDPLSRLFAEKLARTIRKLEGARAALEFWKTVPEDNRLDHRLHYHRARLYLETGDHARAREAIGRALEMNPGSRGYLELKTKITAVSGPSS